MKTRFHAIWFVPNEGDAKSPKFGAPRDLVKRPSNDVSLAVPAVADWNNDDWHDLVIGRSDGSVVWHRNTAEQGTAPVLGDAQLLVKPSGNISVQEDPDGRYDLPDSPARMIRLCVADYNDDGNLDLLLGDVWTVVRQEESELPEPDRTGERKAAFLHEQNLSDELEALQEQEVPENESEEARNAREKQIAAKTTECAQAWRAIRGNGASNATRHGSVWYFERLSP